MRSYDSWRKVDKMFPVRVRDLVDRSPEPGRGREEDGGDGRLQGGDERQSPGVGSGATGNRGRLRSAVLGCQNGEGESWLVVSAYF